MEVISICLSDLPKEKMTVGKNSKKYINLVVDKKKEVDKYGNTHTVYVNQTKEEREAKENKIYVGNGKEYHFNNQQANSQQPTDAPAQNDSADDLPF